MGAALGRWLAADAAPGLPRRWLVAAGAFAILVAMGAVLIGRQIVADPTSSSGSKASATPNPSPAAQSATPPQTLAPVPDGFARVNDGAHGLSISLPTTWHRLPSPDAQVSVLATGEGASMLLRTAPLGIDIEPESIGPAKKIAENLVRAAQDVSIVRGPKRVDIAGLPGYLYLYTYLDPATGRRGGHAHYFMFHHQALITVVFQVVPAGRFASLASRFDQIARTLRASDVPVAPSLVSPPTAPAAR